MAQIHDYADILTRVLQNETRQQLSLQPKLRIVSACDHQTGEFLLILLGWDKDNWYDTVLFHARLIDGLVVIETDNLEDGLKSTLIEAGIPAEHIVSGVKYERMQTESLESLAA